MKVYIIYVNDLGMSDFEAPDVHAIFACGKKAKQELRKLRESNDYEYSLHCEEVII